MPGKDIDASDWTERDLLTRELAAERLAADEAETLAELTALQAGGAADPGAVAQLQRRLTALRATRANVEADR
ncbi:hypothetical protein [Mycobacterium sp.]|uniref:hypothetical protein n=1 Tax=Mycobacterium sp. TaxID=1785 RepID=UPI002CCDD32B|nr:hypothetical protein [Mycobacterium sp.]HME49544.1 hypothetical protein [Mycobacterium sp.]